jgi:hypothetical protein
MRSWSTVTLALIGLFVAAVAQAQKTHSGIYTAYLTYTDVPLPAPDALKKVDASKVKFLVWGPCDHYGSNNASVRVRGMVAPDVDLADDNTALEILRMGIALGQEQLLPANCKFANEDFQGTPKPPYVTVELRIGDPTTFTTPDPPGYKRPGFGTTYDTLADEVGVAWFASQPTMMRGYGNAPKALKRTLRYDEQQARQQNAEQQQQLQAEKKRESDIAARRSAFVKSNHVARFVSPAQLFANPFVFKGQVVAMVVEFQRMNSASEAVFFSRDHVFIVSDVPTSKFTQKNRAILVAGSVLGNTETKLPLLGPTLVPKLRFVGSVFCQAYDCSDFGMR